MLYGYGVDMMEENKLLAMAKSPNEAELEYLKQTFGYEMDKEGTNGSSGTVRMDCILAG